MAVKLRLTRVGKTKQPQYRIVAADSRSPRDGRFIEIIGQYNPRQEPSVVSLDTDKAAKYLSQGAQPTERVAKLLQIAGVALPVKKTTKTAPKPAKKASAKKATAKQAAT
jgi:small subunit ribosomal protein S16